MSYPRGEKMIATYTGLRDEYNGFWIERLDLLVLLLQLHVIIITYNSS
jgi:hypothetical protein